MVGRLELLTPERERLAEAAVRDLGWPDAATRRRAFDALRRRAATSSRSSAASWRRAPNCASGTSAGGSC